MAPAPAYTLSAVCDPERSMHIALVVRDLGGGGAERSVLWLARGLLDRGHRVDILLFRAKIHFSGEVPKEARLFVVDAIRDRLTEECAAPELARLVRLHASTLPLHWINMARALHWDLRCLPGRRLARWSNAVANYLEIESPDCLLPNLSRAEAATFLAGRSLARLPPIVPIVRGVVRRDRSWHFAPMLAAVAPTFMAFSPASVFTRGTFRERLSWCLR